MNWIDGYVDYTYSESPIIYRKWVGVSLVAAALQRKVYLSWDEPTFPNLYIVLVGPAGCRKGTAMRPGRKFLESLGIAISSDSITREALIEQLQAAQSTAFDVQGNQIVHSSLSIFSPELTVFIGYEQRPLVMALTDWFDCADPWRYTTKGRGDYSISGTWVNMIGATTPTLLQTSLTDDAATGGLTSRIIFVYAAKKEISIPLPFDSANDKNKAVVLINGLERIHMLQGEYKYTEGFIDNWVKWYERNETHQAVDDPHFDGYLQRRAKHVLKLCMIFSASKRADMIITDDDLRDADELLTEAEAVMPYVYKGIGKSDSAQITSLVQDFLMEKGDVRFSEVMRRYRYDADKEAMSKILSSLVAMRMITIDYTGENSKDPMIKWILPIM